MALTISIDNLQPRPRVRLFLSCIAKNVKMCYTYDQLGRVVVRSVVNLDNNTSTSDIYEYDAAGNIDGMFSQVLGKVNGPISIPAVREMLFSVTDYIDSFPDAVISAGEDLKNTNTIFGEIAGNALVGMGEFIDTTMNFVGDVVGADVGIADLLVDGAKKSPLL